MVKKTQSLKRPPRLVVETEDKTFQYSVRSAAVRANTDLWSPTQEERGGPWKLREKQGAPGKVRVRWWEEVGRPPKAERTAFTNSKSMWQGPGKPRLPVKELGIYPEGAVEA